MASDREFSARGPGIMTTPKRRNDPIEDYREWANNSLNPGHWLGANVPPAMRGLWSTTDRRPLGTILILVNAAAALYVSSSTRDPTALIVLLPPLILMLTLGAILCVSRQGSRRSESRQREP